MSDKIVAALKSLDVNNDQHWTTDGAPRIDTLKILVGNPGLSREDVNAALPGFSRATAASFAATGESGVPPVVTDPAVQQAAGTAPVAPVAPVVDQGAPTGTDGQDNGDGLDELPNLNDEPLAEEPVRQRRSYDLGLPDVSKMDLEEAREYMSQLVQARSQIQQAIPEAQNRIAALEAEGYTEEQSSHNPIQAYLASQVRASEERAALRKTVEESGVDLKNLAKQIGPSPIDAALNTRPRQARQIK